MLSRQSKNEMKCTGFSVHDFHCLAIKLASFREHKALIRGKTRRMSATVNHLTLLLGKRFKYNNSVDGIIDCRSQKFV